MTLNDIKLRVKRITADEESNIFSDELIQSFIDEAIDRVRNYKLFQAMEYVTTGTSSPTILPNNYHYLLAVYAAARCFFNDERFYQSTSTMNEFESKFEELINKIESGDVELLDENGTAIATEYASDCVVNKYFITVNTDTDGDV